MSCFCRRTALKPFDDISSFTLSKIVLDDRINVIQVFDTSSSRTWVVFDDRSWMNLPRYVIIPRNHCDPVLLVGVGIFVIALIFAGSGLTPLSEEMWPI